MTPREVERHRWESRVLVGIRKRLPGAHYPIYVRQSYRRHDDAAVSGE